MRCSKREWSRDEPRPASKFQEVREQALELLREEVREGGIIDHDREAQALCRLAFSVCPPGHVSRSLVHENQWLAQVDETWVCRHLGWKAPHAQAKIITATIRELQEAVDQMRSADQVALLCVTEQSVVLDSIVPRSILKFNEHL